MSVYSGFATREQETFYYKLLDKTLQLMSKRLVAFFRNDDMYDDRDWVKKMRKIFKFMNQMDQSKHLQPRFSGSIVMLIQNLRETFGATSSISKSPPSLIGGNNTASTLQIIEEEEQSEHMLQSLQYKGPMHKGVNIQQNAPLKNFDQTATATFFPAFKAHQPQSMDRTQIMPSHRKDYSPISVDGVGQHPQNEESFSQKLFKKISETRLADPNQDMASYIQNGVKQRTSFMGIMSRDLNRKVRDQAGSDQKQPSQTRNHEGASLSVRTTTKAINQSSLLDLVSGVTTSDGTTAPYAQNATIGGLRNDRRFTLNGIKPMHQRYPDRASTKLSPQNQGINTQSSIFTRRDDSCGSVQSYQTQQMSNGEDYRSNIKPVPKMRLLRQADDKQSYHQSYSHSAAKLPSAIQANHQSNEAIHGNAVDLVKLRDRGQISATDLGQPVYQLHTKHYHYNTNNIKIQMMPNSQLQDISKISAEGETFREESRNVGKNSGQLSKTLERQKRKCMAYLIDQGQAGKNQSQDYKYQLTTGQPRRVLVLNSQLEATSAGFQGKLETPLKTSKKYFQLY